MELSKKELESLCMNLKISKQGTKQELIDRLIENGKTIV